MSNNLRKFKREAAKASSPDSIAVKLEDLVKCNNAPRGSISALQLLASQPLPARQAFELSKAVRAIGCELEAYESTRKALCERFSEGKMKEGGHEYDIPAEKLPDFEKEHLDLLQAEVSLAVKPLKIESLNGAQLSAGSLMQLSWLIVD